MTSEHSDLDHLPPATWRLWAAPALIVFIVLLVVLALRNGESVTGWLLIFTAVSVLARWVGYVREWRLWR